MEGQYWEVLRYCVPVFVVTSICCLLSIRWAIDQFNNESVLFRESERLELGLIIKRMFHGQEDLPTVGQAMLCGILLLVIRFFASLSAQMPDDWAGFVRSTLVVQVVLIATPALLMAILLTRRPLRALSLSRPSFWLTLPVGGLMAVSLHPLMMTVAGLIQRIYPINPEMAKQIQELVGTFQEAPLWQVLLVVALLPALCEELAFRGFILSGTTSAWGISGVDRALGGLLWFGARHFATVTLGKPGGTCSATSRSRQAVSGRLSRIMRYTTVLSMTQSRLDAEHVLSQPLLAWAFVEQTMEGETGLAYSWPAVIVGTVVGGLLLMWLKCLPYRHLAEEDLQTCSIIRSRQWRCIRRGDEFSVRCRVTIVRRFSWRQGPLLICLDQPCAIKTAQHARPLAGR